MESCSGTSIDSFLGNIGLKLTAKWLSSCISELKNSNPGFDELTVAEKGNLIIDKFLSSDLKLSCGGVDVGALPENVTTLHHLPGRFILQVNEIKNVSCESKHRYREVAAGRGKRRLMLTMTDGVQQICGFEITPIKDLNVLDPAGLKVIIHNADIMRGMLVLKPQVLTVLGGVMEDLEAARKKLVEEEVSRGQSTRIWVEPLDTASGWKENMVGGSANDAIPFRSSVQDLYLDIAATGPPATNTTNPTGG